VPAWALWCLRGQLALVYFYAGVAKINADWLRGAPLGDWLAARASMPVIGGFLGEPWCALLFSYGSLLFDLLIAPALLWRRTRPIAFVVAVGFHLLNWQLFGLGIFPWLMIVATTLFFSPAWPRCLLRRLGLAPGGGASAQPAHGPPHHAVLALLALYFAVQVAVPLRHFLYPGNVSWTEEGHRFSWHMMLRDKHAQAALVRVDRTTGQRTEVPLMRYLTARQGQKMAARPELLQQFARWIAAEDGKGQGQVGVHAVAIASLNGRPRQWLVDPRVDLAAEPRTLGAALWIVPLGVTLPIPLPPAPAAESP
jgi:hypothetical protein